MTPVEEKQVDAVKIRKNVKEIRNRRDFNVFGFSAIALISSVK
jgi:hypothetical protein